MVGWWNYSVFAE